MALTFDEMVNSPLAVPAGHRLVATITVVITQEDGRTGFVTGPIDVNRGEKSLSINTGLPVAQPARAAVARFNDRGNPPFSGNPDIMGFRMSAGQPHHWILRVFLLSWGGGTFDVDLALPANLADGKVYLGYGETIGHGAGRAVHAVSFNNLRVE